MISMAVRFKTKVLTPPELGGQKFVPLLDVGCDINTLIQGLINLKREYDVIRVFIAGDNIVGSCADTGDYACLVAEIK
jgi:GTP cyclohydrolase III